MNRITKGALPERQCHREQGARRRRRRKNVVMVEVVQEPDRSSSL
jgi:hypothetical protein